MKKNSYKVLLALLVVPFLVTACNEKNQPYQETIKHISLEKSNVKNITKKQPVIVKDKTKQKIVQQKKVKQEIVYKKKKVNQPIKDIKTLTCKSYPKQILQRSSCTNSVASKTLSFDIIKKGFDTNNTLLIVGGIQGDEPGGFMAASLIATHYKITKGSIWVVPNFNFYSIIKRNRGPFGDLNRKFATLSKDDPDYELVQRMKSYILDPHISMVINLHDGSGYYRSKYIDKNHNPSKWGNASIIDQNILPNVTRYSNIKEISDKICNNVNKKLLKEEDKFRTKNTHTKFKKTFEEKEMAKTLTYFAITHNKAALGNESSKDLTTEQRVYYKLLSIESLMDQMGIKYKRKFNLNPQVIKNIFDNDIEISLYDGKINLPLSKIRNILKYFPVREDGTIDFVPSNPLISIIREKDIYTIYYGNRRLFKLKADYIKHLKEQLAIDIIVDNSNKKVHFGDIVEVSDSFLIKRPEGYRVNIIGYTTKGGIETDKTIKYKHMIKRFSIDRTGKKYRAEFYKNNKFVGMIVIKFK